MVQALGIVGTVVKIGEHVKKWALGDSVGVDF
jgi:D-arabinose 1-dehydrogenase-like Zn-dependent alcohol dehydrogenase